VFEFELCQILYAFAFGCDTGICKLSTSHAKSHLALKCICTCCNVYALLLLCSIIACADGAVFAFGRNDSGQVSSLSVLCKQRIVTTFTQFTLKQLAHDLCLHRGLYSRKFEL